MAVWIALHLAVLTQRGIIHDLGKAFFANGLEQALGQDNHAIWSIVGHALDDRAENDVAQVIQRKRFAAEFFGNDGQRIAPARKWIALTSSISRLRPRLGSPFTSM